MSSFWKDMEKLESSTVAERIQNGVAALGNSLEFPQKVKYRITTWPCNSTLRWIAKGTENICLQKFVYYHSWQILIVVQSRNNSLIKSIDE